MVAHRVIATGYVLQLRAFARSRFNVMTVALMPLFYSTIAFFLFRAGGNRQTLLWVALGAGLMGIWSSTLVGSGGALQRERWAGTLELLVAAPAPFVSALIPMTLATATFGIYSLASTLVWGRLAFGMPLDLAHPVLFVLAIPATVLALGFLGLVLASTFILYRQAFALSNMLEYPIWLVTGLLVPLSLLPGWVEPLSWVLGPTWGVRALREAAEGGGAWPEIGMCLGLALVYLALGTFFLHVFERLARRQATLALT